MATAPNQTWSWDITKLWGRTKWTYFYLYVVLDIFSRYAVGWMVADRENSALAGRLIEETCHKQGVQPRCSPLHSDRGAPMTSKCTAQLLADLGVTRSLSRPQVSDDNPFSEAQFKTLKYHPGFPGRFHDITAAIAFCRTFFPWYNTEHRHGGSRCSPRTTSITIEPRACWSSAGGPFKPPGLVIPERFVRGSHNRIPFPKPSGSTTCDTHNRRNCSVNRNRHCLKVVDRFRAPDRDDMRARMGVLFASHARRCSSGVGGHMRKSIASASAFSSGVNAMALFAPVVIPQEVPARYVFQCGESVVGDYGKGVIHYADAGQASEVGRLWLVRGRRCGCSFTQQREVSRLQQPQSSNAHKGRKAKNG